MIKKYLFNIFIGLDQMVNTILWGDPDETISSRLGRIKEDNGGVIPKTRPWCYIVDKMLDRIDPNHSTDSIEKDEGHKGLKDKPKLREDTRRKP